MGPTNQTFNSIGVIGAGQMGAGIAQVMATFGFQVILQDVEGSALNRAQQGMEKSLVKLIEKGKVTEQAATILARVRPTTSLEDFAHTELVIEAATENEEVKKKIFRTLDGVLKE